MAPIIRSHLASDPYRPVCPWPETTTVQWGRSGLVVARDPEGESYATAFFEAFPGKGFFRGEGAGLEEAERAAFAAYARTVGCTHLWARRGYTNGLGTCLRCGMKTSVFRPVTRLGAWKDPVDPMELETAMEGRLRPFGDARVDTPDHDRFRRRTELRLRRAGVALPATPTTPGPEPDIFRRAEDPYREACRAAVLAWYRVHRTEYADAQSGGPGRMFGIFALRALEAELETEEADTAGSNAAGTQQAPA